MVWVLTTDNVSSTIFNSKGTISPDTWRCFPHVRVYFSSNKAQPSTVEPVMNCHLLVPQPQNSNRKLQQALRRHIQLYSREMHHVELLPWDGRFKYITTSGKISPPPPRDTWKQHQKRQNREPKSWRPMTPWLKRHSSWNTSDCLTPTS